MDWETPSNGAFGYFIWEELLERIEDIFQAVNARIFEKEHVDLKHLYIDVTKLDSYSRTDCNATFMRMRQDYMGNDQLLPTYNIQIGVTDDYIAVMDVQ